MKAFGCIAVSVAACSVWAGAAQACPVCMLADPKTAGTYLSMTLMMSALPLALLGGLIYWLRRRYSPRPHRVAPILQPHSSREFVTRHSV
jgi:hypothetical protein